VSRTFTSSTQQSLREDVRDLFQLALEASGFLGIVDEQSGVARLQMGANLNNSVSCSKPLPTE